MTMHNQAKLSWKGLNDINYLITIDVECDFSDFYPSKPRNISNHTTLGHNSRTQMAGLGEAVNPIVSTDFGNLQVCLASQSTIFEFCLSQPNMSDEIKFKGQFACRPRPHINSIELKFWDFYPTC